MEIDRTITTLIEKETEKSFISASRSEVVNCFINLIIHSNVTTISRGIKTRFIEKDFEKFGEALKDIVDVETFFKILYTLLTPANIPSGTLGSCLNRYFEDKHPNLTNEVKQSFFTTSNNPNPKKDPEYFESHFSYGKELKILYDLRNGLTHNNQKIIYPSFEKRLDDVDTKRKDIQDCIVAYLSVVENYFSEINHQIVLQEEETEPNFNLYLENIRENFRHRIGRFIHIRSHENLNLSQGFVIERLDEQSIERLERKGTVNELRKQRIPEKRMLLWGDAGLGKSTTLEYLAYSDAEEKLRDPKAILPVYILLGILTDKNVSIKQSIFNKIGVDYSYGEKMLKKGSINLFLDGVNEIPKDDNNQLKTLRQREIQNLLNDYKQVFIILSNRPQADNIFKDIPVFQLQKMDKEQIKLFVNRNTDNNLVLARNIIEEINKDARLEKIIRTPLMLSRLIEIVRTRGEFPKSEGEIIDKFINSLYYREKEEKKDANFNTKIIHRLLRYLGYQSLEKKETNSGMQEDEVLNYFVECKKNYGFEIDTVYVLEISTQLGILEVQDDMYTFAHQAYQDYYHAQEEKAILGL